MKENGINNKSELSKKSDIPYTTIDGREYTEEELDEIRAFAEFVKPKRR